ncbi:ABC transporter permease subunit [Marinomonas colpomeniae]|uniref:ABC transporter permease subunit n=1 Tax=Marinomonas colpomeniae TaxID=2774408 RepID=A0ABR8P236_9GAMM|nr:ABC transporter permease subunit [Marinomonas colpomeniae]MBD5772339.1 ABC transporter permease subunit [Marinomonas colpomeniae]
MSTYIKKTFNAKNQLIQVAFLLAVIVIIAGAYISARDNLAELGISSGFDFLNRATGWGYGFSLLETSIEDPYKWTLFSGFINTLFLGSITIILPTALGFIIGTARDSYNITVQAMATLFIQTFRNIPLILQLVFWYAVLIHMPSPRQAHALFDVAYLSNRGMMIPSLKISLFMPIILVLILTFYWTFKNKINALKTLPSFWVYGILLVGTALYLLSVEGQLLSIPNLKGLRFVGGTTIPIELITMIISTSLYGAAYIAEVVRGGLNEVPKGLVEAGKSLGLSERMIWLRIKMPMALRTIIPPLGNQWVFMMKATTVGVAIGFSDLFMLISTSITQSGQTLELIAILMGSFLLINFSLAQFINYLNSRMTLKGH